MPDWDTKHPCCENCGTKRRFRRWKGFCWRCAPLARKLQKIADGTYRHSDGRPLSRQSVGYAVGRVKAELKQWRELQRPLDQGVSGNDIVELLTTLANVADSREYPRARTYRLYHTSYRLFEDKMSEEAREHLYEILVDIVEHLPSPATRRMGARRPFWFTIEEDDRQQQGGGYSPPAARSPKPTP